MPGCSSSHPSRVDEGYIDNVEHGACPRVSSTYPVRPGDTAWASLQKVARCAGPLVSEPSAKMGADTVMRVHRDVGRKQAAPLPLTRPRSRGVCS